MARAGFTPRVKRQEREVDHVAPSIAEIKNEWVYTSTPSYAFIGKTLLVPQEINPVR
jgi:hypothetical protein